MNSNRIYLLYIATNEDEIVKALIEIHVDAYSIVCAVLHIFILTMFVIYMKVFFLNLMAGSLFPRVDGKGGCLVVLWRVHWDCQRPHNLSTCIPSIHQVESSTAVLLYEPHIYILMIYQQTHTYPSSCRHLTHLTPV